jgi:excisionase family DNA binding protein
VLAAAGGMRVGSIAQVCMSITLIWKREYLYFVVPPRAQVPGYLTVKGAAEHLKLAPRSVRDLIYAGRLPSVRLGRVHFMSVGDVELERRRRLGLALPPPRARPRRVRAPAADAEPRTPRVRRTSEQTTTRRQRAAARAELLERWLHAGRHALTPDLPFHLVTPDEPDACAACQRSLPAGARRLLIEAHDGLAPATLCLTCGRRAMLRWADDRRREATAARRLAADVSFLPPASAA